MNFLPFVEKLNVSYVSKYLAVIYKSLYYMICAYVYDLKHALLLVCVPS